MKKTVFAIAILLACVMTASAQRSYRPRLDLGLKMGATMSNMSFTPTVDQKMLMGMISGLTVRYSEEKLFGLLAEINIDQRGWEEKFDTGNFQYSRRFTYLDIPIMTHINFGGKRFRGFVNLGPSIGFMIGDEKSGNFDFENPDKVEGFPIKDRHVSQMSMPIKHKFDYGIVGGLGGEFRFRERHALLLEVRYYFGLGNVFPNAKKDEFSASRSTSIQVSIGYAFRLK